MRRFEWGRELTTCNRDSGCPVNFLPKLGRNCEVDSSEANRGSKHRTRPLSQTRDRLFDQLRYRCGGNRSNLFAPIRVRSMCEPRAHRVPAREGR